MTRQRTKSVEMRNNSHAPSNQYGELLTGELEPITPDEAVEMYIADRKQELRQSSMQTLRSALRFFKQWCAEEEEIENLNGLTGRQLHQYRIWRREEAPTKTDVLSKHSEKSQQKILRRFIRYCEQISAVVPDLHAKVRIPSVPDDDVARSNTVDAEQAREVLQWLADYHYASLEHVTWLLLADTGARIGTIVAADDDYCPHEDSPYIRVRHRPDTGTKLKNGKKGERLIALSQSVCSVIDDFLEHKRPDVVDDYGREPLLATTHGRVSKGTIRKYVYKWTRPCAIGNECPHGREFEKCDATKASAASKCPSSESPHAIRRGYITHQLSSGVERSYLSGRCDVTDEVLETHYDARDERARMEVRRRALDHARRDHSGYGEER